MTVERLTQKIKLGDKHMIQDSMRRLITMISENKKAQEEIIKFLPENEILKIMSYLEDHDPMFRKLTAKFLLELVYSNYSVQQVFCNVLGILPCDGKVCINQIPESFRRTNKGFPDCIEVLKRTFVEELRESLPYCWYFTPENADQADSQVRFISQDEKKELENSDLFVDPLYAMVGFVVRTPKAKRLSGKSPEAVDKYIPSYIDFEPKKNYNPKVNNKTMNPVNNSLNQSINARSRTNSTSIEKSVFKSVSPVRNLTPGIVTVSSTVGYPKKSKFKTEPTGSFSICNSERLTQNKVPIVTEMSEESNRESIHLGTHYLPGFKRYMEIKDKTSPHRESTLSTDTYDYTQNIKLNDSHLETSVSNSISHKGSFAVGLNERSPNIAHYKAVIANNEKKGEALKKNVEKPEKAAKHIKSKPSELDQKAAFKSLRDNNSFSFSASTTPKNNLLSKILKDKPAANKQAKTKTDQNKKLNSTSTSMTAKHVSQKSSIGGQKNKLLNKTENEYANKKYGFHPSLMKSIDLNDRSHGIILGEDRVESAKENLYQDIGDRPQSCKNNSSKNKTYNLSSVLKSSISTPRTPTESLKASLGLSAKILNSRKSQDVTYQASIPRDKRKSEAFASFQKIKTKQFDIQDNIIRDSVTEFSPDHGRSVTPKIYM